MKTKQLERLREIEKRINKWEKRVERLGYSNDLQEEYIKIRNKLQKIKDNWKDGCEKEVTRGAYSYTCGEISRAGNVQLCSFCKKQNKEKDEILGRILG